MGAKKGEHEMSKIIFSIDSACDIPQSKMDEHNIYNISYKITMGNDVFTDRVDIDPQKIYDFVAKTKKLPKTSAVNTQEMLEFFKGIREKEGDVPIIHTVIGKNFSLTYQNAVEAAKQLENVYIIDSSSLSSGIALLVLYAIEDIYAAGETDAKVIADKMQKKAYQGTGGVQASFVLDTLEFLHKGGRCSGLARFGANLLKIKPTIAVKNGKMDSVDKMRGRQSDVILKYIDKLMAEYGDKIDKRRAFVTHTLSDEGLETAALEKVNGLGFEEVIHQIAGCTITTHCGKNTLGLLFLLKDE